jgi:hypothetical protein
VERYAVGATASHLHDEAATVSIKLESQQIDAVW